MSLLLTLVLSGCRAEPDEPIKYDLPDTSPDYNDDPDGDGYGADEDCDNEDASINPGVGETVYDGVDNDCDEATPDDDLDYDGYDHDVDCDDEDAAINPGAEEVCDEVDNDCNGAVDEAGGGGSFYRDADGDGYGDDGDEVQACSAPEGYVEAGGDCDDGDAAYNPGAVEDDCTDPNDYNCDGSVGYDDADGDGYPACVDCDDGEDDVHPGATETCNEQDDDCDSEIDEDAADAATFWADADGDGYGDDATTTLACAAGEGWVDLAGDCDDADAAYNPAAEESCDDPEDYNCDGSVGYEDGDGDGWAACEECDDADPAVNPDGVELCDGVDNDCDGSVDAGAADAGTWYADDDDDGFGNPSETAIDCAAPDEYVGNADDCDDNDDGVNPSATEACNGADDDCDGEVDEDGAAVTWYTDADGDGYGDDASTGSACELPEGAVETGGDCDDGDASVNPGVDEACTDTVDRNCDGSVGYADADGDGWAACEECDDADAAVNPDAAELCNGLDDDCDGVADDSPSDGTSWYADGDGDGYGDPGEVVVACEAPEGFVGNADDCDDDDRRTNPGASESCNGWDDDCDGSIDDDAGSTWYVDEDGDGWGGEGTTLACEAPEGYAAAGGDCDDADAAYNPGATEACTDLVDYNCDGSIGYSDGDGDGWAACEECDDGDAAVHPGAAEVCDGIDNDCDGSADSGATDASTWYADADGDGFGDPASSSAACTVPSGYLDDASDCDDANRLVNPDATEACNGYDDDCDGSTDEGTGSTWYEDVDGDGWGSDVSVTACEEPSGYAAAGGDCDDADAAYNPAAAETCTDSVDYNCDGSVGYSDADGDGWAACEECDDLDAAVNPDADEVCDGVDNDCDGGADDGAIDAPTWYADADRDGYGDPAMGAEACDMPSGYVDDASDCDDGDRRTNPAATESCNGWDDDCDSFVDESGSTAVWYYDGDDDGYGDDAVTDDSCSAPSGYVADAGDCDDADPLYNPAAAEACTDTEDFNCDGSVGYADADGDGWAACEECDDEDAAVHPGADEVCNDADDDCDGVIDGEGASGATAWYADGDSDGFGDASASLTDCDAPTGFVADATDCDDDNRLVNPEATERCDSVDNDCDGSVDEEGGSTTWYADADDDGYGVSSSTTTACSAPDGYSAAAGDCDDGDAAYNPGASESCTDTEDYNCDGSIGFVDEDGDGWAACVECDDADPAVKPGATEVCDGVDNDCDGDVDGDATDASTWYADLDGDGYGDAASTLSSCEAPSGYVANASDCDDRNNRVKPGASEVCDGVDNDCDAEVDEAGGTDSFYADADGDGYGDPALSVLSCDSPDGYVENALDCDDDDSTINPAAAESCTDEVDRNCDGSVGRTDADGDGWAACEECDDSSAEAYPGGSEVCDGLDNDCDGTTDGASAADASTWYRDADRDGYGNDGISQDACEAPSGYTEDGGDCDDSARAINPSATETCDGADNDCDGTTDGADAVGATSWYLDSDGDGYGSTSAVVQCDAPSGHVADSTDCDDGSSAINPGEDEACNGWDDDCDGSTDGSDAVDAATWYIDGDGDGYGAVSVVACSAPSGGVSVGGDCADGDYDINPSAPDVCDYVDNDCDSGTDEDYRSGTKYVLETDCGSCGNDCSSYSYDNASTYCNTTPATPRCDFACDSGFYDANAYPGDGCECEFISSEDANYDGIDADCDGIDGDPSVEAVYVSTTGSASGTGSIDDPLDSIQDGLDLAAASGIAFVVVAEGSYRENVELIDGITLYGGYDATFTARDSAVYETRIEGVGSSASSPATLVARDIADQTILEGFTVVGNAASGVGESAVALWIEDCTDGLIVRGNRIEAGAGRDGRDGANGDDGTDGDSGDNGTKSVASATLSNGGSGGATTCDGSDVSGGSGGGNNTASYGAYQDSGSSGMPSGGSGGGAGCDAIIYSSGCGTCYIGGCWDEGADGSDGGDGSDGSGGSGAADADGDVSAGYWVGASGASGSSGTYGHGGGGGGSGSSVDVGSSCGSDQNGGTGGGGGAGGCGGDAGGAGEAGGASIAVMLVYSTATTVLPLIEDNVISAGNGGFGGDGGDGGVGGVGGIGGTGGTRDTTGAWCAQAGGNGGEGGDGGGGGGGGGGAGGPSYAVAAFGLSPDADYVSADNTLSHGAGGSAGRGGIAGSATGGDGTDAVDGPAGDQNW